MLRHKSCMTISIPVAFIISIPVQSLFTTPDSTNYLSPRSTKPFLTFLDGHTQSKILYAPFLSLYYIVGLVITKNYLNDKIIFRDINYEVAPVYVKSKSKTHVTTKAGRCHLENTTFTLPPTVTLPFSTYES